MFEEIRIGGTPVSGIALQTRRRSDIPNSIAPDPSDYDLRVLGRIRERHRDWIERKAPCGVYNCAGHVWASRRTEIFESDWYDRILAEDGYRQLPDSGPSVRVGDLAVYRLRQPKKILHVGTVVEIKTFIAAGTPHNLPVVPIVLSKWNASAGEYLHRMHDVPLEQFEGDYNIEVWTDRQA